MAVARALVDRGHTVRGTSRNPDALAASSRVPGVEYLPLDLADSTSIEALAAAAGDVEILVNNAGESQCGPLEELPPEAIERLFALNVFGAVRLTQLVLPGMRQRRYGRVVMVGSMNASFPFPFRSSYVASKAAIKGFASAARHELTPYGVWISTVEPGSINTGISDRRTRYIAPDSIYRTDFETLVGALDAAEAHGTSPERVAETIITAIEAERPAPVYAVGSRAPLLFALRRLLPEDLVTRRVSRMFGLKR
jgi:short-subunit dehydrogenase